ncbi:RraA family protein [Bordetella sp. BOR01]|uniref:RraA family protein n=1 Tax=Bordetella sp. BOR01 TaxID=2854779 RepID=UPI001C4817B6|nr:RraA family protein [Bordetella sp. BOR01]MBV7482967.1 RraA family protein [Bordetella sp. BOR01]
MSSDSSILQPLVDLLKSASAAAAYEAIGKCGDLDPAIAALVPDVLCVGPAFTVRAHPHYSAGVSAALDQAPAGSVVVIDVGGDPDTCVLGGTGALVALRRQLAGYVTNGRIRDLAALRAQRFPVFARGATVRSSRKEGPADFQVPVAVGGQVIRPGDLVCADDDGVVVVAQERFGTLAERLAARLAFEQRADASVQAGVSYAEATSRRP